MTVVFSEHGRNRVTEHRLIKIQQAYAALRLIHGK